MSRTNIPDSTIVPDDMLRLQRKRIAAQRPEMDKLLNDIMKQPTYEAMLRLVKEGLVKMTESYKTLSIAIHDVRGHQAPFNACQDELCLVNKSQIDASVGLIATASELEPKGENDG